MKITRLHFIKTYLQLGLFFYFKKIKVYGLNNIPKNKSVLLVSNHQNALLDALLIACNIKGFAHFLTRAGVFKKEFVAKLLKSFQLIPVYRIRDGWSNITNNNEIFDGCTKLLHEKETVIIFPEGNHNLARRVRPLSKGFTRIVFSALEKYPEIDLQIVPIGLNFINAEKYPDSVAIYFGEPIDAAKYNSDNKNENVIALKKSVRKAIANLTADLPQDSYHESLEKLEELQVDFLDPESINNCISNNFKDCKSKPKIKFDWLRNGLKFLLILNLLIPYAIWKFVAQPKIKEIEFTSTFRFALAVTLVPFYLLLIGFTFTFLFSFKIAIFYVLAVLGLTLFTVKI